MMATPICTGTVNGSPVRFFRSPLNDGRPDFPWIAWGDLTDAYPLSAAKKAVFFQRLHADWPDIPRTVATADGVVTLVPHFAAQGFTSAMTECLGIDAEKEYALGAGEALKIVTAHLSFPDGVLCFARDAMRGWDGGAA